MDVTIRPITEEDTDNIVKWRNNPNVMKNFIYQELFTREGHLNWYKNRILTGEVYQYIIECDNIPVGSVYFRDVDRVNNKAEYGIFIGEDGFRGQGVGTKAAKLAVEIAFKELKLHKIFLRVIKGNDQALNSYKKVGFEIEGTAVDDVFVNGEYKDIIFMSMINEWR